MQEKIDIDMELREIESGLDSPVSPSSYQKLKSATTKIDGPIRFGQHLWDFGVTDSFGRVFLIRNDGTRHVGRMTPLTADGATLECDSSEARELPKMDERESFRVGRKAAQFHIPSWRKLATSHIKEREVGFLQVEGVPHWEGGRWFSYLTPESMLADFKRQWPQQFECFNVGDSCLVCVKYNKWLVFRGKNEVMSDVKLDDIIDSDSDGSNFFNWFNKVRMTHSERLINKASNDTNAGIAQNG